MKEERKYYEEEYLERYRKHQEAKPKRDMKKEREDYEEEYLARLENN